MVDPDNEERLLKIPHRVVSEIRAEAMEDPIQQVKALTEKWEKFSRDQFDAGYSEGQSDAIATAVQQLKDYLQHDVADGWMPRQKAEGIIATITGEHL
jgi:hypothetical protein